MTAAVPLIAEALNLAITEHWDEVRDLKLDHDWRGGRRRPDLPAEYDERFSAGVESLAVAVHARLQEQGTLG